MTWEAIVVAVSLVGMHAAWGVAYWCRRRLAEAHETCRNKLWDVEQQRDRARAQRDEAIAQAEKERDAAIERAEQAEAKLVRLLKLGEDASIRETAAIKRADRAEEEIAEMVAQIETADKRVAAAIKRAERAEQDNRRLRALRTRITEVLHEHDHPGTVEVVVNTMSKGAGDDD